jgi:hypothetical protein
MDGESCGPDARRLVGHHRHQPVSRRSHPWVDRGTAQQSAELPRVDEAAQLLMAAAGWLRGGAGDHFPGSLRRRTAFWAPPRYGSFTTQRGERMCTVTPPKTPRPDFRGLLLPVRPRKHRRGARRLNATSVAALRAIGSHVRTPRRLSEPRVGSWGGGEGR